MIAKSAIRKVTASAEIEAGLFRMADDVWAWSEKPQAFGRAAADPNAVCAPAGMELS